MRACDGFYFPIHTYAVKSGIVDDERACRASCSTDAALYYFPTFGGAVATAVDAQGQSYSEHPKAFAFRKSMTPGCTCSAPAWSAEARARHAEYARLEAIELEKDRAFVTARAVAEAAAKEAVKAQAAKPAEHSNPEISPPPAVEKPGEVETPAQRRTSRKTRLARGEDDYDFTTLRRPQRGFRILQPSAISRAPRGVIAGW